MDRRGVKQEEREGEPPCARGRHADSSIPKVPMTQARTRAVGSASAHRTRVPGGDSIALPYPAPRSGSVTVLVPGSRTWERSQKKAFFPPPYSHNAGHGNGTGMFLFALRRRAVLAGTQPGRSEQRLTPDGKATARFDQSVERRVSKWIKSRLALEPFRGQSLYL